jgi:hypothetical protein
VEAEFSSPLPADFSSPRAVALLADAVRKAGLPEG